MTNFTKAKNTKIPKMSWKVVYEIWSRGYEYFEFWETLEQKYKVLMPKNMSIFTFRNIRWSPSRVFPFRYINKHDVLVRSLVSKIVNAFRSKVIINWSYKFAKIKADILSVNWGKIYWTKIHPSDDDLCHVEITWSWGHKHKKYSDFKNELKVAYELLLRSYENLRF